MTLLDLSRNDLAEAANVHRATISAFLHDNRPISSRTLGALEKLFKSKGIVFLEEGDASPDGGPGIRMRTMPPAAPAKAVRARRAA